VRGKSFFGCTFDRKRVGISHEFRWKALDELFRIAWAWYRLYPSVAVHHLIPSAQTMLHEQFCRQQSQVYQLSSSSSVARLILDSQVKPSVTIARIHRNFMCFTTDLSESKNLFLSNFSSPSAAIYGYTPTSLTAVRTCIPEVYVSSPRVNFRSHSGKP